MQHVVLRPREIQKKTSRFQFGVPSFNSILMAHIRHLFIWNLIITKPIVTPGWVREIGAIWARTLI